MKVEIGVVKDNYIEKHLIDPLSAGQLIEINELDFVFVSVHSDSYIPVEDISLAIGNTHFLFDEPVERATGFHYPLKFERIKILLPGIDGHVSKSHYDTVFGEKQFYRLFLNEIGYSRFYVNTRDEEILVGKVKVSSSKITQDNFSLITEYLILNNYFGSNFLYKVNIEGDQSTINNSLIEALRKLLDMLRQIRMQLRRYTQDPIVALSSRTHVVAYNEQTAISPSSLSWLMDHIENVFPCGELQGVFKLGSRSYEIQNIQVEEPVKSYDAYENKIIHGFLITLQRVIYDKELLIAGRSAPKTRISSFRDYLIQCFHTIIARYLYELKQDVLLIRRYFDQEMPVSNPLYGFPDKFDGFFSKPHYREMFQLMHYAKNIFSVEIGNSNFSLEIESFDKLFEVYCFYLLRDILAVKFNAVFEKHLSVESPNNKDAGVYKLAGEQGIVIFLYFESMPSNMVQYTAVAYKPDFIISVVKDAMEYWIVLDAKFKNYNKTSRENDFAILALKYLHKIGPIDKRVSKMIGLISLSLGLVNKRNRFYDHRYDIKGASPALPHIANVEIDPKTFQLRNNVITELIDFILATGL